MTMTTQTLSDLQTFLMGASPFVVVFLCGIVLGYIIKVIRFISNRFIPGVVIVACSVMFRFSQKIMDVDFQQWYNPNVRLYMIGALVGFTAWIAHSKFLRKWIDDKLDNGDTNFFPKKDTDIKP